jgi:hypothetical protein
MDAGLHRLTSQVEVELTRFLAQGIELVPQRGALRSPLQRQCRQLMIGQENQLPSLVATSMPGDHLSRVEHAEFIRAGENRDGPTRQARGVE